MKCKIYELINQDNTYLIIPSEVDINTIPNKERANLGELITDRELERTMLSEEHQKEVTDSIEKQGYCVIKMPRPIKKEEY